MLGTHRTHRTTRFVPWRPDGIFFFAMYAKHQGIRELEAGESVGSTPRKGMVRQQAVTRHGITGRPIRKS